MKTIELLKKYGFGGYKEFKKEKEKRKQEFEAIAQKAVEIYKANLLLTNK
jgi:phosphoenolpyruvate synthase/pyruvate phosphate dikinase